MTSYSKREPANELEKQYERNLNWTTYEYKEEKEKGGPEG